MEPIGLRISEAVTALGLSRATVYRLIASNKLDARKIGRRTVVTAASVTALLSGAPSMNAE